MKIKNIPLSYLKVARLFTSGDYTREILCAAHIQSEAGKEVEIHATDGRRAIVIKTNGFAEETGSITIRNAALDAAFAAVDEMEDAVDVEFKDCEVRIEAGGIEIRATQPKGTFPDIKGHAFPSPMPTQFACADTLIVNAAFLSDCATALSDLGIMDQSCRIVREGEYGPVLFLNKRVTIALMPMRVAP